MNQTVPKFLRHMEPASLSAPTSLTDKIVPFLEECDRALHDNHDLREQNAVLLQELRHSRAMQDAAADRVDALEAECSIARTEVALLRARLFMFGDAASAILKEVSSEAKKTFVASGSKEVKSNDPPMAVRQIEEYPPDDAPPIPFRSAGSAKLSTTPLL